MVDPAVELFGQDGTPHVIIAGGGFGGIAAGVKLKRAGIHTFTIVEKSTGVGGTWWDNRYPGAEVDVASHLYSFSFKSHDWSRTHARQAELQAYLEETVDDYGLRRHLRLGAAVDEAVWDERAHTYTVRLDDGEEMECHVFVSAVGMLSHPRYPTWPGLDDFAGPRFHTARWEHHDLTGKRVGIVGTGSTAVQIVPEIAGVAGRVLQFQREPGWIMPKGERDFTPEERAGFRSPRRRRVHRLKLLYQLEKNTRGGKIFQPGTKVHTAREALCRRYLAAQFADRPDLLAAVTPTYPYPGKRPIFHSTYYQALKRDDVELIPRAVASVTATGLVDVTGEEHPIDVLVMATGFEAARYLPELDVVGTGGISLHKAWNDEPEAFLGITVPGFPNFYMLYGPNTNGGEIVTMLERQAEYMVRAVRRMRRQQVTSIEVKARWCAWYNTWVQSHMQGTSWTMSRNYFTAPSGRVVTQWPFGPTLYGLLTRALGRFSEVTGRRAARPGARHERYCGDG